MGSAINKLIGTVVPIVALLIAGFFLVPRILTYIQDYKTNQDASKAKAVQDQADQQNGFLGYLADNIFGSGTANSIRSALGFGNPSDPTNAGSSTTKDTTIATDKTTTADKTTPSNNSQTSTDPLTSFVKSITDTLTGISNAIQGKSSTSTTPSGETVKTDTSVKSDKTVSSDTKNVSDSQNNTADINITRSASDTAKALADFLNLPNNKIITPANKIPGVDLGGNVIQSANATFKQIESKPATPTPSSKPISRDPFNQSVQL